ncbi:hypothetical protein [Streptomyces sp. NPDC096012]|uniref:hypothetical protein n=1 Tax=Streptomyces sp. NPDC096012 TaxID=3155684 RepID=UPI00336A12F2
MPLEAVAGVVHEPGRRRARLHPPPYDDRHRRHRVAGVPGCTRRRTTTGAAGTERMPSAATGTSTPERGCGAQVSRAEGAGCAKVPTRCGYG